MSLSSINQYENKISNQQTLIQELKLNLSNLLESKSLILSQHKTLQQQLNLKQNVIQQLKSQNTLQTNLIQQLKNQIQTKEKSYKILYDNCYGLESISMKEQQFLIDSFDLDSRIRNIKYKAQVQQAQTLERQLISKQNTIKQILKENTQLKGTILKLTQEHYLQIIEIKKNSVKQLLESKQKEESKDGSQSYSEIVSTDYLIEIKNAEIQYAQQKYKKEVERNKLLFERQKELKRQLAEVKRQYYCTDIDLVYIQNNRLVEQNKNLKELCKDLDPKKIEQFRTKLKQYQKKIQSVDSYESQINKLQKLILQNSSKIAQEYNSTETKSLKQKQAKLATQLEKCFIILNKFNQAFRKINPYFDLYKYDLANIDQTAQEVLSLDEVNFCVDFAKRSNKLESDERMLKQRINNFNSEIKNQTQRFDEKIDKFKKQRQELELQKQFVLQKTTFDKIIKIGTDKVNQLVNTVNTFKNKELFWQGEKRLLQQKLEQAKLQNSKYEFIRNPVDSIKFESIVIPKITFLEPNLKLSQQLKTLQGQSNNLNIRLSEVIQEQKINLVTIKQNKNRIQQLNNELKLSSDSYNLLFKSNKLNCQKLQKLQNEIKRRQQQANIVTDESNEPFVADVPFNFATNSDISIELIKQLSEVLNHNESITSKLLDQLQSIKYQYQILEETHNTSNTQNQKINDENKDLKFKLTQSIIQIQSSIKRQQQVQEQIQALRNQNTLLKEQTKQRQTQNIKYKQAISTQFNLLSNNIKTINQNHVNLNEVSDKIDENSPSLVSIIQTLKEMINQKNQDVLRLQNELNVYQRERISVGDRKREPTEFQLEQLLNKAINVINHLKAQQ